MKELYIGIVLNNKYQCVFVVSGCIKFQYYLPIDVVGCDCPKPENIDCDAEGAAVAPNPKDGAALVAAPNPNVGVALVVAVPNPNEEPGVPDVVEEPKLPNDVEVPNPNVGAADVVVDPNP